MTDRLTEHQQKVLDELERYPVAGLGYLSKRTGYGRQGLIVTLASLVDRGLVIRIMRAGRVNYAKKVDHASELQR